MSELPTDNQEEPQRKRSLTSLTLAWITEKVRRSEAIKEKVRSGCYEVNAEEIAASLVNED